jgi:hypothetical protein
VGGGRLSGQDARDAGANPNRLLLPGRGRDADTITHTYGDRYSNRDSDAYAYCDASSDRHANCNAYRDSECNPPHHSYAPAVSYTAAALDAAAQTLMHQPANSVKKECACQLRHVIESPRTHPVSGYTAGSPWSALALMASQLGEGEFFDPRGNAKKRP